MTQQVEQFAALAGEFCAWAESAGSAPEVEAATALRLLARLYGQALELPATFGEEEPDEVADEAWKQVYRRFGALPFNYYAQCFDPGELPGEASLADLADDLADIWRDRKEGLSLYAAGHLDSAAWAWRWGFWHHWGLHAAGAIYALHFWQSQQD